MGSLNASNQPLQVPSSVYEIGVWPKSLKDATTTANDIAVVTFIVEKQILWKYCLLMMIAAALGGYLGAQYARRMHPHHMRLLVVLIGLGMAAYFFWKQYS